MEDIDLRTLSTEPRKERRRAVVRLYHKGERKCDIAATTGLQRTTVGDWINAYEKQGEVASKEADRGRAAGTRRSLTPEREAQIRHDIVDHTPDQLKMVFALWNAQALRALVRRYFGMDMSVRTVAQLPQSQGLYATRAAQTGLRTEA